MLNLMTETDRHPSRSFELDSVDARLLLELGGDVRLSATELASRLHLSRNTVQAHLLRLDRQGLLRFASALDQVTAAGFTLTAFVTIDISQHEFRQTATALSEIPEVIEAYGITGDGDLWCRIVAQDAQDLGRVLDRIGACPGVRQTRTSLAIRDAVGFRVQSVLRELGGS
jgi:DNA-binding Lrp family transcriptional regulator